MDDIVTAAREHTTEALSVLSQTGMLSDALKRYPNLRPFAPGRSGNPAGAPKLSPELRALKAASRGTLEKMRPTADAELEKLIRAGNVHALKIYYDRTVATLKPSERCVQLDYPPAASLSEMASVNAQALADGRVTPAEYSALQMGLANQARIMDSVEFDQRLAALEADVRGKATPQG